MSTTREWEAQHVGLVVVGGVGWGVQRKGEILSAKKITSNA